MKKKRCTKCHEEKPIDEFTKDRSKRDGHRYSCKICDREKRRKSYQKHPEIQREYSRKSYQKHPGRVRELKRKSYQKHIEKERASSRKYREEHLEERIAYSRKYDKNHKEEKKAYKRKEAVLLNDNYIKAQLYQRTGIKTTIIPKQLIFRKREQLKIHRFIKKIERKIDEESEPERGKQTKTG